MALLLELLGASFVFLVVVRLFRSFQYREAARRWCLGQDIPDERYWVDGEEWCWRVEYCPDPDSEYWAAPPDSEDWAYGEHMIELRRILLPVPIDGVGYQLAQH